MSRQGWHHVNVANKRKRPSTAVKHMIQSASFMANCLTSARGHGRKSPILPSNILFNIRGESCTIKMPWSNSQPNRPLLPTMNPEFRQTLNTLSRNLETANEAAQENIYTFTRNFIDPCLSGIKSCIHECIAPCFPSRQEQLRRKKGRSSGRAELNFDFYDDWDDDEDAGNGLLGWGNDELDSLLAGNRSPTSIQPARQRTMSYGSRGRRKGNVAPSDLEPDPTVIPSSSYIGFLERLPWKFGSRGLRYKPSAANLEENPGGLRIRDVASEPLIEENEAAQQQEITRHGRQRSDTAGSHSTTNSLSSRGDLIMSDEDDDAIPLDDEFAVMLGKRTSNTEDQGSNRTSASQLPGISPGSTRTVSSKSTKSESKSRRSSSRKSPEPLSPSEDEIQTPPLVDDLKWEEEQARLMEEMEVEQRSDTATGCGVRVELDWSLGTWYQIRAFSHHWSHTTGRRRRSKARWRGSITVSLSSPMREAAPQPTDNAVPSHEPAPDPHETPETEPS